MIIVNNLCNFLDLHHSLSVAFVMYVFNGQNKDILYIYLLIENQNYSISLWIPS